MSDTEDSKTAGRFPWLEDGNYAEWRMRMEAVLIRKGLFGMVEIDVDTMGKTEDEALSIYVTARDKRTKTKMAEARALMIEHAGKSQLVYMRSADPMQIWQDLAKVHRAHGLATRLALRRKLMSSKKNSMETMPGWIAKIKGYAWDLEEIGYTVGNEDIILALTMGLDDSYENFVISLDSTPAAELTLDYVTNRLLNEEVCRDGKEEPTNKSNPNRENALMSRSQNNGNGNNQGSFGNNRNGNNQGTGGPEGCWRCGQIGHIRAFCKVPVPKKPDEITTNEQANIATEANEHLIIESVTSRNFAM